MTAWDDVVNDTATGYKVQAALVAMKIQPVKGYKISLTSVTTQQMFDSDTPLYGEQVADHVLENDATVSLATMNEPLIEVEIGFTAKTDLYATMTDEELLANSWVSGAIEVPDARFKDWFPSLNKYLVVSDTAVGGYIELGNRVDGATLTPSDLAQVQVDLLLDGVSVAAGASTEVLDNPMNDLLWMVHQIADEGRFVQAGQSVSSGTFFVPPHLTTGTYEAKFTGSYTGTTTLHVQD